jgi:hypothetical protein
MENQNALAAIDRFEIFEQCNLHQRCIDTPWGRESAERYIALYWPEGSFVVNDIRHTVFTGHDGLKQMFDYAHSVFPLDKWFHTMGPLEIDGNGDTATVSWRWQVNWKDGNSGVVSTGTYKDKFTKRDGVWRCLERISDIDPNWPAALFQTWVDEGESMFRAS